MLRLARQVKFVAVAMLFCAAVSFAADNAVQDVLADSLINRHLHEKLRKKLGNEDDLRALCSGLKICMDIDYEGCFEEDKKPWPHHKYDKEFCGVFKEVEKRGFLPDPNVTMAAEVYARLGRRYRAIYVNEGTLPLNEDVIKYLFDNMPFTAQLALQDSAGQKHGMRNVFFGYGHAHVLKWQLHGTAIAYLDMDPLPGNKLKYKLTAIVFPANSVLNSIMQMKVFRSVVNSKIDQIVDDVKKSSKMYFSGNKEPMLKSAALKSSDNVQYVLDFEEVVNGAHWELGDFERLQKARREKRKQDMQAVPIMVNDNQIIKDKK